CFPHIVNLACKAVLAAITNLQYVDDTVEDYEDYEPGFYSRDCMLGQLQRRLSQASRGSKIHNSNLKQQQFSEYVQQYFEQDYRLLRDVPTRWSSTLLMINQVLLLKEAIDDITSDNEFKDLYKFKLTQEDWDLLKDYQKILEVPHAFQEILSGENTPTLCYSIPAFQSFIDLWTQLKEDVPEWEEIIEPGLVKLEEYVERLNDVHVLAMGKIQFNLIFTIELTSI
ncbi:hypothetical protein BYT27DRAFT_7083097, partial [Phlegmacium glaucopus]